MPGCVGGCHTGTHLWQVARSGCAALRMHKPAVPWEHRRAGAGLLGARSHVGTAAGSVPAPCSPSPVGAPVVRRRGPGSHGCPVPAVRGRGRAGPGGSGARSRWFGAALSRPRSARQRRDPARTCVPSTPPLPLKGPAAPRWPLAHRRPLPPPPRAVGPPAGHPCSPPRPALVRSAGRGGAAAPPPTRGAGGSGAGSAARGEISGAGRPGGVGWRLPPAGTPAPAWNVLASRRRAAPAPGPGPGRGRGGEVTRALPAAGER